MEMQIKIGQAIGYEMETLGLSVLHKASTNMTEPGNSYTYKMTSAPSNVSDVAALIYAHVRFEGFAVLLLKPYLRKSLPKFRHLCILKHVFSHVHLETGSETFPTEETIQHPENSHTLAKQNFELKLAIRKWNQFSTPTVLSIAMGRHLFFSPFD